MHRGRLIAAAVAFLTTFVAQVTIAQMRVQSPAQLPALQETPVSHGNDLQPVALPPAPPSESQPQTKEKLARVWANEPQLVRLARDKFGAELTETDAKFFAAIASNEWTDPRRANDSTYKADDIESFANCPRIKADRIAWLCNDSSAAKLVPSKGVWLRGTRVVGQIDLYRCNVPFALTFYDCLLAGGLNVSHAKLQGLDIRNCCSNTIQARGAQIAESVYLISSCVYGGLDFIEAQIAGDFDFIGGAAFHGTNPEEMKKRGIALNFHDAKVGGDIKLCYGFRSLGQIRLIDTQVGNTLCCSNAKFIAGGDQPAIDAHNARITTNAQFADGFRAEGAVDLRRAHIGGELDCSRGRIVASNKGEPALDGEMANVGGQINLGSGFHADGEVRLVNAVAGGDVNCTNGHFLHASGMALCLDGSTTGHNLRLSVDPNAAKDPSKDLPPGFVARGTVSLCGARIDQDLLASGAQLEAPGGMAVMASNVRIASRADFSGVKAQGCVNLSSADIEHELDLRCSQFDGKGAFGNIALWANGAHIRGHVYCNQVETPDGLQRLKVNGLTSFQFAVIAMHWDLSGAQFINPGGDAFEASDCRVGGYVNLDTVLIDGRASFSRAKIDGMWIINKSVNPERLLLDMRFAHIWVIKDERLDDWPPAGQLQLEGLVYDHFDDDSPLDVNDRLAWLRRQYAPIHKHSKPADAARHGAPNSAAAMDRGSPRLLETFGQNPVRGRETRAQLGQAQRGDIVPVQATMPAPQTTVPGATIPAPSMAPAQTYQPRPMVVTAEEVGKADTAAKDKDTTGPSVAAEAKEDSKPDADKSEDSATADTRPAVNPSTPDPFGRRYITQPYTQLASVYRAIGQDEQANDVLVARAERLGELAAPFSAQGLWYRYLGRLIGYGYEPFRAIKIGLAIVVMGTLVFALGAHRGLMAETNLAERVLSREDESGMVSPTYPRFNALVYSLDVFLPFVDLNQVGYWIPGERPSRPRKSRNCLMHIGPYSLKWSSVLHGYLWFQTLAGWTLCTLLAAAVTGIVQS